mgnify:CR=1 FL=1
MINKPDEGEDINAISLPTAPPYFLDAKGSPQGWLDIIEMRFRIQKLTNQVAMFHHALCVLPPELMQSVAAHLATIGSHEKPFEELKRRILQSFKPSLDEIFAVAIPGKPETVSPVLRGPLLCRLSPRMDRYASVAIIEV